MTDLTTEEADILNFAPPDRETACGVVTISLYRMPDGGWIAVAWSAREQRKIYRRGVTANGAEHAIIRAL